MGGEAAGVLGPQIGLDNRLQSGSPRRRIEFKQVFPVRVRVMIETARSAMRAIKVPAGGDEAGAPEDRPCPQKQQVAAAGGHGLGHSSNNPRRAL